MIARGLALIDCKQRAKCRRVAGKHRQDRKTGSSTAGSCRKAAIARRPLKKRGPRRPFFPKGIVIMDTDLLWNGTAALLVVGATVFATILRAGFRNCAATLRALAGMARHQHTVFELRAELAGHVERLRRDGPLRANLPHLHDAEFEDATDAMIRHRSVAALLERHEAYKAEREGQSRAAVNTLAQAAELGPAIGLAGTLVALATAKGATASAAGLTDAIGMAVATTLYGLVVAHFLFAPLAEMVARRGRAEEEARQEVIDWLAEQVAPVFEHGTESKIPRRGRPTMEVVS